MYLNLYMCPVKGTPYYYGKNNDRIYDIPTVVVPEEYRRFLHDKHDIYRNYMREDQYFDSAVDVLNEFPTWEHLKSEFPFLEEDFNWTEEDHDLFHEAMRWFASQSPGYTITWS